MLVDVSNIIVVKNPTTEFVTYCRTKLVFKNPEYNKKLMMGWYLGGCPKTIQLYDYDVPNNTIYLPIGCLDDVRKLCSDDGMIVDHRTSVDTLITSNIKLRDYQTPAVISVGKAKNGILLLPCGMGKTECALAIAAHVQEKTLFIAHTKDLISQAEGRCRSELNCTTSFITDGKVDLSGDMVFATVQTLQKKLDEIPQDAFGLVVCDEVHHLAATAQTVGMFRECLDYFAAMYKIGLTATLHRSDGLEVCIPKLLGPVIYEIKEDNKDYVGIYEGREIIRFPKTQFQVPVSINFINTGYSIFDEKTNTYRDVFDKSGMTLNFSKLLSDIASDKKRNDQIVTLCNSLQGSTIILSDRVEQLKYFEKYIDNCVEIDGNTKKKDREQAIEDIKSGKVKVLLASYKLAKEGLDCKILENIILATPIKDDAVVIQCIGRCQRPYGDKKVANVYDLVDDVSTLHRFLSKRKSIYRIKGWLSK